MKKTTFILPILILALLQSCASVYKPVNPKYIKHTMHETVGDIALSYKYDASATNGNRKPKFLLNTFT
jgi:hypothetical protein